MKAIFLILLNFASIVAAADVLSPEMYLNKISMRLTGNWPSRNDYGTLAQAEERAGCREITCLTDFFRGYARTKMNTPQFYSEAVLKTFEKFGFQLPNRLPFPLTAVLRNLNPSETYANQLLIYRVFHDDEPVDQLFTSQVLWSLNLGYADLGGFAIENDGKFKKATLDLGPYKEITDVEIERVDYSGHPNVAGLFSSERFLKRYWNNPINNGRKRAAAVFKTMICDALFPALDRGNQKDHEERIALGVTDTTQTDRSIEEIHKNRHANQKDCAVCHVRLDPLAHTMRPLELGISQIPSSGFFRYYTAPDQLKSVKSSDFHDLVVHATEQPKYSECQLNWMFSWIVGNDIKVHPLRYMQLLNKFDGAHRRVKSTIEELILSPEFQGRTVEFAEPESLKQARKVFEGAPDHCVHCHGSFLQSSEPELKSLLSKIAFKLDLPNDGAHRLMPPATHWWAPNAAEIQAVKTWIQEGAPLGNGHVLLSPEESRNLLKRQRGAKK